ncbi:glycoside hydrolase family 2 protein [Novipirellula artificiosorum]|nr:sugar-binding domain-containing protein [Novipirellula artificiosorum]
MGRNLCCWIVLASFASSNSALAQPGAGDQVKSEGQLVQDLSGYRWKLKRMRPGQGIREGLHELPQADIETLVWMPARVPGDVYTDLWKAGALDDPYFGRNSVKAQWVMYDEWWYSLQFNVSEDLSGKVVRLEFDGVDYGCEVWLNGHALGRHEGMFSPFSFDVSHLIDADKDWHKGRNMLMVKLDPPPQVNHKVAGLKTPWFGDYWRDLVPFGIWRPVRLVATGKVRVDDLYVKSKLNADGSADVEVEVTLENHSDRNCDVSLPITLQGQNFSGPQHTGKIQASVEPGLQTLKTSIPIDQPELWWPWDLGKPNLYTAKLRVEEGDEVHDRSKTTFGIRQIKMDWNPGFTRDEVSYPRTVKLNGKNHFIRSACWGGPPDIFVGRTSPKEYKTLIDLAKAANMNNIRIFGWHPPEIPEFYQYCDEVGLTVWQDVIPLGTANISQEKAFVERIYAEAEATIKERRNHPSLILIEGGEEAFLRASDPQFTKRFLEELGRRLQQHVDLPYVPDSPLTCPIAQSVGYKPKEAVHALSYFYSMGKWLMEDWYSSLDFPIVPELAITSVPSVESLKKFIPEDELWPPGPSWGHHWADFHRLRMQNFDTFGDQRTGSLEEFVAATQDAQGTIFQLSVEHFRRAKPRCSGIALCHFITYWPDMKWAIVDNYQQPKRSYRYVQRGYQPLLVNLQFDRRRWKQDETFIGKVWIVNDTYQEYNDCKIKLEVLDENSTRLHEQSMEVAHIRKDSSSELTEIHWKIAGQVETQFHIQLSLLDREGESLSQNQYMLLIGDQAEARNRMKAMGQEKSSSNNVFTYGNYYRYFPDMIQQNDNDWQSQTQMPRADLSAPE